LSDAVAAEGDAARAAGLEAPVAGEAVVEEAVEEAVEDPSDQVDADTAEPTGDSVVAAAAAEGATTNLDDVDDLFARLRAGAVVETEAGTVSADAEATPPSGEPEPEPQPAAPTAAEAAPAELSDPAASPAAANAETGEPEPAPDEVNLVDEAPGWLSQRDEALAPLRVTLVRQVKLAIGNEQNEVLDKVRRQKGKAVAADVLPDLDAQTAQWAAVVSTTASEAYRLARSADGGDAGAAPDDLAPTLARSMVEPLRERVVAAIDGAHEPGETSAQVAERIGARYREWKNRAAEASSEDVLVAAWARGRFDAAGDGAMLNWSTPPAGCCPDCADNVLEPTLKGENFPTGQPYPPAHPGCRCGVTTAAPASVAGESVGARSNGGDSNHPI
jgi:hypothetical protein